MSYPQQPGNWSDPSWPPPQGQQQPYGDPYQQQPPADPYAQQAYPASPAMGYPASPGYPPADYQQQPPMQPYGYPVAQTTNGLAIAAMIVSIIAAVGLCIYGFGGLLGPVGAVMGHVSRKQIRERGEGGEGMAMAGIIIGWIALAIGLAIIAAMVFFVWWAINEAPPPTDSPTFD